MSSTPPTGLACALLSVRYVSRYASLPLRDNAHPPFLTQDVYPCRSWMALYLLRRLRSRHSISFNVSRRALHLLQHLTYMALYLLQRLKACAPPPPASQDLKARFPVSRCVSCSNGWRSLSSRISGAYSHCLWVRLYLLHRLKRRFPTVVGWRSSSSSVSRRASFLVRTFTEHGEWYIGFPA